MYLTLTLLVIAGSNNKVFGEEKNIYSNNIKYEIIEDDADKNYGKIKVDKQDVSMNYGNTIYIPREIENTDGRKYLVCEIGEGAFENCQWINSVYISRSVECIKKNAFKDCLNLENIYIEEGSVMNTIDEGVFLECRNLKMINIPESIKYIGKSAFYNCRTLEYINIPKELLEISESLCAGCSSLKSVDLRNIVTINNSAFIGCCRLKKVDLSEKLKTIGSAAFINCIMLEDIDIPDSVSEIGTSAFSGCRSLKSISIPSMLHELQDAVFKGCINLEQVDIPSNINHIFSDVFSNCVGLSEVRFLGDSAPEIEETVFKGCNKNLNIVVLKDDEKFKAELEGFGVIIFDENNNSIIEGDSRTDKGSKVHEQEEGVKAKKIGRGKHKNNKLRNICVNNELMNRQYIYYICKNSSINLEVLGCEIGINSFIKGIHKDK